MMTAGPELPFGGCKGHCLKAAARRRRQAFARPLVGPPQYSPCFECSRLDSYVSIKTSSKLKAQAVSSKESDSAAESARILDEALDLVTSDKQKQTLLKVVTKFHNRTLVQIQINNAALLIQHYRHHSEHEETVFLN